VFNRDYFGQFGDVYELNAETDRFSKLVTLSVEFTSENSALNARIDLQRLLLNT